MDENNQKFLKDLVTSNRTSDFIDSLGKVLLNETTMDSSESLSKNIAEFFEGNYNETWHNTLNRLDFVVFKSNSVLSASS
jgi:hypothetical protein